MAASTPGLIAQLINFLGGGQGTLTGGASMGDPGASSPATSFSYPQASPTKSFANPLGDLAGPSVSAYTPGSSGPGQPAASNNSTHGLLMRLLAMSGGQNPMGDLSSPAVAPGGGAPGTGVSGASPVAPFAGGAQNPQNNPLIPMPRPDPRRLPPGAQVAGYQNQPNPYARAAAIGMQSNPFYTGPGSSSFGAGNSPWG